MSTPVAWRKLAQIGPIRWGDLAPWRAARTALGVVIPLALGWVGGHLDYGAYAALGAMPAGFASFQGETRSRVWVVVVASLGMAVSTFVGATLFTGAPWLLVPVVAVWGYLIGLAVCLGQRANVAVLQWAVALLIAIGLPLAPREAALRAGFALAGGLFQAVLVVTSWTWRAGFRERTTLAASFRALAGYASGLAAGGSGPPPPLAFPADTALEDPNPLLSGATRLEFTDLLEEAERIRASLAALAVRPDGEPTGTERTFGRLAADAAITLNLIADALVAARPKRAALVRKLSGCAQLTIAPEATWRWAGEALLGQLRGVARIVARLEAVSEPPASEGARTVRALRPSHGGLVSAIATLRANITPASEPGRHALRLAAATALAELFVLATGLYQGRWVTLTVFIVLKPDYGSTLYRGVHRVVGTMFGVGLGLAAALLASLGQGWLVAAAGVCIAAAYALFDLSYLLFSVFLTAYIVVLLDLLRIPAIHTTEARLLDTSIGAVLALAAYLTWPTWEGATAQEKFARLLEAHRDYLTALLRELVYPRSVDAARLRARQADARRTRSNAEAATMRLLAEPAHATLTPGVAQTLIAAVARLALAELALHALAVSRERPRVRMDATGNIAKRVDVFRAAIDMTMGQLADALRRRQRPPPIPALRPLQVALRGEATTEAMPLVEITDRLVDAANTLDAILREHLPQPPRENERDLV